MTIYTFYGFVAFNGRDKKKQRKLFRKQRMIIFLIHFICHVLIYLNTKDIVILGFYLMEFAFLIISTTIYRSVYKNLSQLIFNHMQMLFVISFIMLGRLSTYFVLRQFAFVCAGMGICLFVPYIIEKWKSLEQLGWFYGLCGIGILFVVLLIGKEKYGAKNWLNVGPVVLQPSEFVKILYVLCIAALLSKTTKFKDVVSISILAGIHVMILVLEKDLGGAVIFFITYLFMLYVASMQFFYLLAGLGSGAAASVVAYQLFSHVRVRVMAWKNPWSLIDNQGYQITQSLFAIGTGGWFGMGLGRGLPLSVPIRESDFIFSIISEELGGIFAFCIILIYLSCFIMFINIAMKLKHKFYKLTALGFSVLFMFQTFLTIGGVTKFIPSTGVTLPLVSYGGSSVLSTIIIFNIIQGLYVLNQNEEDDSEKNRKRKVKQE